MTMLENIVMVIIRFFVHPFPDNKPVDFKTYIRSVKHILIICPYGEKEKSFGVSIDQFVNLFPNTKHTIIYPEKFYSDTIKNINVATSSPVHTKYSPWKLFNSAIKSLTLADIDLLLDLDPHFSLLSIYLCRLIQPEVRICLSKKESQHFYNLQFKGKGYSPYPEKRFNLFQLLRSWV